MPDFNFSDRESLKQRFLSDAGFADATRQPLPGDASTRHYERLIRADGQSFMLMDQPPVPGAELCLPGESETERRASGYFALARLSGGRIEAFVAVADYLRAQGLSAPDIIAVDFRQWPADQRRPGLRCLCDPDRPGAGRNAALSGSHRGSGQAARGDAAGRAAGWLAPARL
ncbi:hypothetical protein [Asticcacaulis sp. MM231]|uniref:hypothetical protein n=1 Tax=Asticcacaulis sp. MM231 TaxID=3157666 RepID=UPI0032D56F1A